MLLVCILLQVYMQRGATSAQFQDLLLSENPFSPESFYYSARIAPNGIIDHICLN